MIRGSRYDPLKRAFDCVAAATTIVLLFPVLLVLALVVRLDLGAPVLFRQPRAGLGGAPFELRKFRTMRPGCEADVDRLSRVGSWLRATSLDELPELWNVVMGEMSLVGPRPLLLEYLDRYDRSEARRQEVRPGLTGLAQVNGRNSLTWQQRFQLDVEYVDNRSLLLDLRILMRTVKTVLRRTGIAHPGHATMSRFGGHDVHG